MSGTSSEIEIFGAAEHNLKNVDLKIERNKITVITGVSGSGIVSAAVCEPGIPQAGGRARADQAVLWAEL